jgi:hypothetical protein
MVHGGRGMASNTSGGFDGGMSSGVGSGVGHRGLPSAQAALLNMAHHNPTNMPPHSHQQHQQQQHLQSYGLQQQSLGGGRRQQYAPIQPRPSSAYGTPIEGLSQHHYHNVEDIYNHVDISHIDCTAIPSISHLTSFPRPSDLAATSNSVQRVVHTTAAAAAAAGNGDGNGGLPRHVHRPYFQQQHLPASVSGGLPPTHSLGTESVSAGNHSSKKHNRDGDVVVGAVGVCEGDGDVSDRDESRLSDGDDSDGDDDNDDDNEHGDGDGCRKGEYGEVESGIRHHHMHKKVKTVHSEHRHCSDGISSASVTAGSSLFASVMRDAKNKM